MELENIILREVSQVQKPKVTCFLSYVDTDLMQSNIIKNRSH
jgi:hypothetical protein